MYRLISAGLWTINTKDNLNDASVCLINNFCYFSIFLSFQVKTKIWEPRNKSIHDWSLNESSKILGSSNITIWLGMKYDFDVETYTYPSDKLKVVLDLFDQVQVRSGNCVVVTNFNPKWIRYPCSGNHYRHFNTICEFTSKNCIKET